MGTRQQSPESDGESHAPVNVSFQARRSAPRVAGIGRYRAHPLDQEGYDAVMVTESSTGYRSSLRGDDA